jgi:uncharacterized membrane protein HdeD (DUF308 family)
MEPTLVAMTAHEQRELIAGIVSAGTGVLIFMFPALLNYIVAAYLVVVGAILIIASLN